MSALTWTGLLIEGISPLSILLLSEDKDLSMFSEHGSEDLNVLPFLRSVTNTDLGYLAAIFFRFHLLMGRFSDLCIELYSISHSGLYGSNLQQMGVLRPLAHSNKTIIIHSN